MVKKKGKINVKDLEESGWIVEIHDKHEDKKKKGVQTTFLDLKEVE